MRPETGTKHSSIAACAVAALAVFSGLLWPGTSPAHWLEPKEIVAGLRQNQVLRQSVGLVDASFDPEFPRLLIIKIDRRLWDAAPREKRLKLASEWAETWRHNVEGGIVGVLDAATDDVLVNYDALLRPRLKEPKRPRSPRPTSAVPASTPTPAA